MSQDQEVAAAANGIKEGQITEPGVKFFLVDGCVGRSVANGGNSSPAHPKQRLDGLRIFVSRV